MNSLDLTITHLVNQFARQSKLLDYIMVAMANDLMMTATLSCMYIWYIWFRSDINQNHIKLSLLSTMFGSAIASIVSRASPFLGLPYRPIPMIQTDIGFIVPYFAEPGGHETASSFPSDHSALIFGLIYGVYLISKKMGFWVFIYALIFMAIPRIYVGLHFATDILLGGTIGVFFVYLAHSARFQQAISSKALVFSERSPSIFYGLLFLLTFQLATMFGEFRYILHVIKELITKRLI